MCFSNYKNFISLVLLTSWVSLVFAEEAKEEEKEPPRAGHIDIEKHAQLALIEELRDNEVVWLELEYPIPEGSNMSSPGSVQVLALQRPSQKPQQHGAVLILPEIGQHADWPSVIRPLRSELPEAGWYTLSLTLPGSETSPNPTRVLPAKKFDAIELNEALRQALNKRSVPEEEETKAEVEYPQDDQSSAPENEEVEDNSGSVDIDLADKKKLIESIPYEDKALAHVNEGVRYLQNQGYQNIVILAYRSSANTVLNYIKEKQGTFTDKGFAFVLVDPLFNSSFELDLSDALGKNFQAPILEVVNTEESEDSVKSRLAFTRVSGANRYMQVNFAFRVDEGSHKSLVRRVRFWLEKHAPGMIVGSKRR